jgi:hypothetical protein
MAEDALLHLVTMIPIKYYRRNALCKPIISTIELSDITTGHGGRTSLMHVGGLVGVLRHYQLFKPLLMVPEFEVLIE